MVTSATIDGKEYDGTLVALQDSVHVFMMGGTNGFWKKTTITGTRFSDTDRVQSVSIKAENLVATRIGQLATIAGYFVSPSKSALAEADLIKRPDLPAFSIDLAKLESGVSYDVPGAPGWTYTVTWTRPAGVVTWNDFQSMAFNNKARVNYFPVPACLVLKLKLTAIYSGHKDTLDFTEFVASTPDLVRLEPLPIDGKLSLSPVCSSSATGTMTADPYDQAFSTAAAVYKALGGSSKAAPAPTGSSAASSGSQ